MRLNTKKHNRRNGGIALIWTAVTLIVLILFVGLAIDVAMVKLAAHQLQNAADAAALAGALIVKLNNDANTRTVTYNLAHANYYVDGSSVVLDKNPSNDNPDGDIFIGNYDLNTRVFLPTTTLNDDANAVKVVARCTGSPPHNPPVSLIFGPIAGKPTAEVERYAIAISKDDLGAGLLVLSEDCSQTPPESLRFMGGPTVEIVNGSIQVNMPSCNCYAIRVDGSVATVYADKFNLVSECDYSTDGYDFDPTSNELKVTPKQPKIPDPYADMDAPLPNPAMPKSGTVLPGGAPVVFQPGYYPDGFTKISTGDNVTFMPGVYVVGKGAGALKGLEIRGGNVCARGVMFYITDGAVVDIGGGGPADPNTKILITEIQSDHEELQTDCYGNTITYSQGDAYVAPYKGMTIFQDRENNTTANIAGGAEVDIKGTIYFPNNHLDLGGTPSSLGIQVIAYTLTIHGTGSADKLIIDYDGRNKLPANSSYLVR